MFFSAVDASYEYILCLKLLNNDFGENKLNILKQI